MNVLRAEALMDVVLAAVAIILVFMLVVRPSAKQDGYYRQATLAVGCFSSAGGKWDRQYLLYSRGGLQDNGRIGAPHAFSSRDLPDALIHEIDRDGGYSRLAILTDAGGAVCADSTSLGAAAAIWKAIDRLHEGEQSRDWTVVTEVIPCVDRVFCEELLGLVGGA